MSIPTSKLEKSVRKNEQKNLALLLENTVAECYNVAKEK